MIKFYAAKVLNDVIDRAVQVHGARGLTDETPLAAMLAHGARGRGSTTGPTRCTAWSSPAGSSSRSPPATAGSSGSADSHPLSSPRTVTQIASSSAATPLGRYGMGIRVTAFVFGSMRKTAWSLGAAAQMPPAPASICQT